MFDKLVVFEIDGQSYAFDSMSVSSIEKEVNAMLLPGAPDIVIGAVNFRNEIAPYINLAKKFGRREGAGESQNIFVSTQDGSIGFKVDEVREICAVGFDAQMDLPVIVAAPDTGYVAGIVSHGGRLVTVIDQNKLLNAEEKKAIDACLHVIRDRKKAEEEAARQAEEARKAAEAAKKAKEEAGE